MRKLSIVVLVLLISGNVYGQRGHWEDNSSLPEAWTSGNVGIGTPYPYEKLHVNGTIRMTGFKLTTGKRDGYVLTSNSSGVGTWKAAPSGGGGSSCWSDVGTYVRLDDIGDQVIIGSTNTPGGNQAGVAKVYIVNGNQYLELAQGFLNTARLRFRAEDTDGASIAYTWNAPLKFYNGNMIERMRIAGNGNVGIGTTAPTEKLDVAGTLQMNGFKLPTGKHDGYVLTSDGEGVGTWQEVIGGGDGSCLWDGDASRVYYNGNVGIGTSSPGKKLDVNGNIRIPLNNRIYFGGSSIEGYNDYYNGLKFYGNGGTLPCITMHGGGNVGIGTSSPSKKLDVNGSVLIRGNGEIATFGDGSGSAGIYINGNDGTVRDVAFCTDNANNARWILRTEQESESGNDVGSDFSIISRKDDGTYKSLCLHIKRNSGYVGIGTVDPQSKLAVNGTITAKEVIVTADGWSDFVFADNYQLMPLNKLENHIKVNKSLPGIPTEKEVLENGVKVGDMQAKLLEKVEELTLYVINQNKEISKLKKENIELKETNENLENRISALER